MTSLAHHHHHHHHHHHNYCYQPVTNTQTQGSSISNYSPSDRRTSSTTPVDVSRATPCSHLLIDALDGTRPAPSHHLGGRLGRLLPPTSQITCRVLQTSSPAQQPTSVCHGATARQSGPVTNGDCRPHRSLATLPPAAFRYVDTDVNI